MEKKIVVERIDQSQYPTSQNFDYNLTVNETEGNRPVIVTLGYMKPALKIVSSANSTPGCSRTIPSTPGGTKSHTVPLVRYQTPPKITHPYRIVSQRPMTEKRNSTSTSSSFTGNSQLMNIQTGSRSQSASHNRPIYISPQNLQPGPSGNPGFSGSLCETQKNTGDNTKSAFKCFYTVPKGWETGQSSGTSQQRTGVTKQVVTTTGGISESSGRSQKQRSIKVSRKNLTVLDAAGNSTKKMTATSSVSNFLEQDTLHKGVEVLDSLDDHSLKILITKMMNMTNKMYGDYLAEELEKHLGPEKYKEIASKGITPYDEFLARKHSEWNNKENHSPSSNVERLIQHQFAGGASENASDASVENAQNQPGFVKVDQEMAPNESNITINAMKPEEVGKGQKCLGKNIKKGQGKCNSKYQTDQTSSCVESPEFMGVFGKQPMTPPSTKPPGHADTPHIDTFKIGGFGLKLDAKNIAEEVIAQEEKTAADMFISDKIAELKEIAALTEDLEDNFTFDDSKPNSGPPEKIFESPCGNLVSPTFYPNKYQPRKLLQVDGMDKNGKQEDVPPLQADLTIKDKVTGHSNQKVLSENTDSQVGNSKPKMSKAPLPKQMVKGNKQPVDEHKFKLLDDTASKHVLGRWSISPTSSETSFSSSKSTLSVSSSENFFEENVNKSYRDDEVPVSKEMKSGEKVEKNKGSKIPTISKENYVEWRNSAKKSIAASLNGKSNHDGSMLQKPQHLRIENLKEVKAKEHGMLQGKNAQNQIDNYDKKDGKQSSKTFPTGTKLSPKQHISKPLQPSKKHLSQSEVGLKTNKEDKPKKGYPSSKNLQSGKSKSNDSKIIGKETNFIAEKPSTKKEIKVEDAEKNQKRVTFSEGTKCSENAVKPLEILPSKSQETLPKIISIESRKAEERNPNATYAHVDSPYSVLKSSRKDVKSPDCPHKDLILQNKLEKTVLTKEKVSQKILQIEKPVQNKPYRNTLKETEQMHCGSPKSMLILKDYEQKNKDKESEAKRAQDFKPLSYSNVVSHKSMGKVNIQKPHHEANLAKASNSTYYDQSEAKKAHDLKTFRCSKVSDINLENVDTQESQSKALHALQSPKIPECVKNTIESEKGLARISGCNNVVSDNNTKEIDIQKSQYRLGALQSPKIPECDKNTIESGKEFVRTSGFNKLVSDNKTEEIDTQKYQYKASGALQSPKIPECDKNTIESEKEFVETSGCNKLVSANKTKEMDHALMQENLLPSLRMSKCHTLESQKKPLNTSGCCNIVSDNNKEEVDNQESQYNALVIVPQRPEIPRSGKHTVETESESVKISGCSNVVADIDKEKIDNQKSANVFTQGDSLQSAEIPKNKKHVIESKGESVKTSGCSSVAYENNTDKMNIEKHQDNSLIKEDLLQSSKSDKHTVESEEKSLSDSLDIETSMNDLAQLLISLQETLPTTKEAVSNSNILNDSFEKFAQNTVKSVVIGNDDYILVEEGSEKVNTNEVEKNVQTFDHEILKLCVGENKGELDGSKLSIDEKGTKEDVHEVFNHDPNEDRSVHDIAQLLMDFQKSGPYMSNVKLNSSEFSAEKGKTITDDDCIVVVEDESGSFDSKSDSSDNDSKTSSVILIDNDDCVLVKVESAPTAEKLLQHSNPNNQKRTRVIPSGYVKATKDLKPKDRPEKFNVSRRLSFKKKEALEQRCVGKKRWSIGEEHWSPEDSMPLTIMSYLSSSTCSETSRCSDKRTTSPVTSSANEKRFKLDVAQNRNVSSVIDGSSRNVHQISTGPTTKDSGKEILVSVDLEALKAAGVPIFKNAPLLEYTIKLGSVDTGKPVAPVETEVKPDLAPNKNREFLKNTPRTVKDDVEGNDILFADLSGPIVETPVSRKTGRSEMLARYRRNQKLKMHQRRNFLRRKVRTLSKIIHRRVKTVKRTYDHFLMLVNLINRNRDDVNIDNFRLRCKINNLKTIYRQVNSTFITFRNGDVQQLKLKVQKAHDGKETFSPARIGKRKRNSAREEEKMTGPPRKMTGLSQKGIGPRKVVNVSQRMQDPARKVANTPRKVVNLSRKMSGPDDVSPVVIKQEETVLFDGPHYEDDITLKPIKTYSKAQKDAVKCKSESNIKGAANENVFLNKGASFLSNIRKSSLCRDDSIDEDMFQTSATPESIVHCVIYKDSTVPFIKDEKKETGISDALEDLSTEKEMLRPKLVLVKQESPDSPDLKKKSDPLKRRLKRKASNNRTPSKKRETPKEKSRSCKGSTAVEPPPSKKTKKFNTPDVERLCSLRTRHTGNNTQSKEVPGSWLF